MAKLQIAVALALVLSSTLVRASSAAYFLPQEAGVVATVAGSGVAGSTDGLGTSAAVYSPLAVAASRDGAWMYVVEDEPSHRVRKIDLASQAVTTVAGNGTRGNWDSVGAHAQFNFPSSIAISPDGTVLFIGEAGCVRSIEVATQNVTTLAGDGTMDGFADGVGSLAQFKTIWGLAVSGDGGTVFAADHENHCIRTIQVATKRVATVAGSGVAGSSDGVGTSATFNGPNGIALSGDGRTLFVAEYNGVRVRVLALATQTVTTLTTGSAKVVFGKLAGLAVSVCDPCGATTVFVADDDANKIYQLDLATQNMTTLAGKGAADFLDGVGANATFNKPEGVVVSADGFTL
jgi:sugar lactone lactonase YvrE